MSWFASNHQSREFLCAVNNSNFSAWCGIGTSVFYLPRYTSYIWQYAGVYFPYVVNYGF